MYYNLHLLWNYSSNPVISSSYSQEEALIVSHKTRAFIIYKIYLTICPNELHEKLITWIVLLEFARSIHNLAPALSSSLFIFKFKYSSDSFFFKACPKYLEP